MKNRELYAARRARVCDALKQAGLTQMIVGDPVSIGYLTGITFDPYERLFAVYLNVNGHHKFFLNRLFNVVQEDLAEVWMTDTDDVCAIMAREVDRTADIGIDKCWPARFLLGLMEHNPGVRYVNASFCVDNTRAVKDADEQAKMRTASRINDACTDHMADWIREGVTEQECADEVLRFYLEQGADGPSFTPICSFGANAADPHHEPDQTVLKVGDCIVLDIGCKKDGYCSDMTRTWFCQTADPEYVRIHGIVRKAGETAESLVKPGVRFCDLDAAARNKIDAAGFGAYFTHRLGHSIGLDDHECDDVSSADTKEVRPGNIFSIEPGIYLPGRFGVRVEDLVLVTETGCEVLNHADRNVRITK